MDDRSQTKSNQWLCTNRNSALLPLATNTNALLQSLGLLPGLLVPLVLFVWILHGLESLIQQRLARRFGWHSVLLTGWLGTPVHELSHALMCVVFRHEIVEMALFRPDRNNRRLGYVIHSHNPRNLYQVIGNFFIGIAPVIGGTLVLMGLLLIFFPETGRAAMLRVDPDQPVWAEVGGSLQRLLEGLFQPANLLTIRLWLFLYLVLCVGSHMGPSGEDYRGAWRGGLWVGLILLTACLVLALLVPETGQLREWLRAGLVPVLSVMISVVGLVGLAAGGVLAVTGLMDRFRDSAGNRQ